MKCAHCGRTIRKAERGMFLFQRQNGPDEWLCLRKTCWLGYNGLEDGPEEAPPRANISRQEGHQNDSLPFDEED